MLKILIGIISKQTEKVGDSLNALSNLIMNQMDKMDADFPHRWKRPNKCVGGSPK